MVQRQGADQVIDYTTTRLDTAIDGQVDVVLNLVHLTAVNALVRPS